MNTQRKNKCTYEGEHEACTHMQGCGKSRNENATTHGGSNAIGRRVLFVSEHREAWAKGF